MLVKCVCFVLGFICGMSFVIVMSCCIISSEESRREENEVNREKTVKAIPIEQLLSILPKYDDYIHLKTYLYNETFEDIYSEGHEDGWNVCLKVIKNELDEWEKENEMR